jgi:hypothetical protein
MSETLIPNAEEVDAALFRKIRIDEGDDPAGLVGMATAVSRPFVVFHSGWHSTSTVTIPSVSPTTALRKTTRWKVTASEW